MQVHDASGDGVICHLTNIQRNLSVGFNTISVSRSCIGVYVYLITVVHQDEKEVEAAHDGGGQVDVLFQTLTAVVAPADRVGGGEDGCASVQGGLEVTRSKVWLLDYRNDGEAF